MSATGETVRPEPLLIDVAEAARRLGISRTTAFELLRTGDLPSLKIGARRLVPAKGLERLVERLTAGDRAGQVTR